MRLLIKLKIKTMMILKMKMMIKLLMIQKMMKFQMKIAKAKINSIAINNSKQMKILMIKMRTKMKNKILMMSTMRI